MKQFSNSLKKSFITGMVVIIPIVLSCIVVKILFELVSGFVFNNILNPFVVGKSINGYVYIPDKAIGHFIAKIVSCCFTVLGVAVIGFITNRVFGKKILSLVEKIIDKLPILSSVYPAAKQFISFIFGQDSKKNFKRVVFVPYPNEKSYCAAFVTGEQYVNDEKYICAFVPTAPNPTSGFLILYKEKDIIYSDYTVEQAFPFIISAGVSGMGKNEKQD
jgi:uncharacterized membrane protein